jgi:hypothetical protein
VTGGTYSSGADHVETGCASSVRWSPSDRVAPDGQCGRAGSRHEAEPEKRAQRGLIEADVISCDTERVAASAMEARPHRRLGEQSRFTRQVRARHHRRVWDRVLDVNLGHAPMTKAVLPHMTQGKYREHRLEGELWPAKLFAYSASRGVLNPRLPLRPPARAHRVNAVVPSGVVTGMNEVSHSSSPLSWGGAVLRCPAMSPRGCVLAVRRGGAHYRWCST